MTTINLNDIYAQVSKQERQSAIDEYPKVSVPGRYVLEPFDVIDYTDVPPDKTPMILLAFRVVGVDTSFPWGSRDEIEMAKKHVQDYTDENGDIGLLYVDRMYLSEKSLRRAVLFLSAAGIDTSEIRQRAEENNGMVSYDEALEYYVGRIMDEFRNIGRIVGIATEEEHQERRYDEQLDEFVLVETRRINTPFNAYRRYNKGE